MQLMDATTPEQAAELGRRLQADMTDTPESFEIFESDEHGKAAVESVAATVQNLQNPSLQLNILLARTPKQCWEWKDNV